MTRTPADSASRVCACLRESGERQQRERARTRRLSAGIEQVGVPSAPWAPSDAASGHARGPGGDLRSSPGCCRCCLAQLCCCRCRCRRGTRGRLPWGVVSARRRPPFVQRPVGRWGGGDRRQRAGPGAAAAPAATMGLEKEKADIKIFMDDDDFNRSSSPVLPEKSLEKSRDRDPNGLNSHLMLGFEDVIAEPESTHSFDRVWICSHALFELSRYLIYKLLTLLLAIPLALVAGILFAVLSCLHIWIVVPFVKSCLMALPPVQAVWKSVTDVLVAPVFRSMGRCFAAVNIRVDHE